MQRNVYTVFSGVTDVKGDRSQRPSQQADPDVYVHVVDKNDEGIVVRGAKITRPAVCALTGAWWCPPVKCAKTTRTTPCVSPCRWMPRG